MNKKDNLKKARIARKPKFIFECDDYKIEEIPLNYKIIIKCARKNMVAGRNRDLYSHEEYGLEEAHEVAKDTIEGYFKAGIKPTVDKANSKNKKSHVNNLT